MLSLKTDKLIKCSERVMSKGNWGEGETGGKFCEGVRI